MVSTSSIPNVISEHLAELYRLCAEFGVARLEVFGSAMTDRFDAETSDIDFIVDFRPEYSLGPFMANFQEFNRQLESLFGRNVDLTFLKGIRNPVFRENIEPTRLMIYEQ